MFTFRLAVLVILFSPAWAAMQEDTTLYLVGRLVMEDGSQVPRELKVDLLCDEQVIRQSHHSKSGTFSFDLGSRRPSQGVTDASSTRKEGGLDTGFARSAWNPSGFNTVRGRVYLEDCRVRLTPIAGFVATSISLGIRGLLDNPDIGEIVVKRATDNLGPATLNVEIAAVPEEARRDYDEAGKELSRTPPAPDLAIKHLERAVESYPTFGTAWTLLGKTRLGVNDLEGARTAFERAIFINPRSIDPLLGLTQLDLQEQRWNEAVQGADKLLDLNPDVAQAMLYRGLARYYLGDFDEAAKSFQSLEDRGLASRFPVALLHLGMIQARQENFSDAARQLRRYLAATKDSIPSQRRRKIEMQLKQWEQQGLAEPGPD